MELGIGVANFYQFTVKLTEDCDQLLCGEWDGFCGDKNATNFAAIFTEVRRLAGSSQQSNIASGRHDKWYSLDGSKLSGR